MNANTNNDSTKLIDNYGRRIDYLRIAVTDRCNLRCSYCMPEEGIPFINHESILTFEENLRLIEIFTSLGISKVRITGGEPFVRKGMINFLKDISKIELNPSIHITTNGVLTYKYIQELKNLEIAGINLSLDTLDKNKFFNITRRNEFDSVQKTISEALEHKVYLKINCVVQNGINEDEIIPIAEMARDKNIEIRFIEEMPFNGYKKVDAPFTSGMIFNKLLISFPGLIEKDQNTSTAKVFTVPGFAGTIGIIGGYSRSFCSSCNRIRITPTGMLKTCLYDNGVLDLRLLLRSGADDNQIKDEIIGRVNNRFKDGFESEKFYNRINNCSMASIGG